jgi:hypothetical protein
MGVSERQKARALESHICVKRAGGRPSFVMGYRALRENYSLQIESRRDG